LMLEVVDEWLVDIVGEDLDALMCQVHLERRPTGERRRKCSCAVRYIAFKKFDGALLTACVSQHYIQVRLVSMGVSDHRKIYDHNVINTLVRDVHILLM